MLDLPFGVAFGDQRAAQPIARIHQAKQTLALAHTHLHTLTFL